MTECSVPSFLVNHRLRIARAENYLNEKLRIDSLPEGAILNNNMGFVYQIDKENPNWQILISPAINRGLNKDLTNDILWSLESSMNPLNTTPKNEAETKRKTAISFLATNWCKLWPIFYKNSPKPDENQSPDSYPNNSTNLPCFTDVKFHDNTIIPFIGIGPDGKIILFQEAGAKEKLTRQSFVEKFNQWRESLKTPLRLNQITSLSVDDVAIYQYSYTQNNNGNAFVFTPAEEPSSSTLSSTSP